MRRKNQENSPVKGADPENVRGRVNELGSGWNITQIEHTLYILLRNVQITIRRGLRAPRWFGPASNWIHYNSVIDRSVHISRGTTRGHFDGVSVRTSFPLLKCKNAHALWTELRTISAQNALDCRILHTQFQEFSEAIPPDLRRNAPGAWIQTPIYAWFASVPIVPVFFNETTILEYRQIYTHFKQNNTKGGSTTIDNTADEPYQNYVPPFCDFTCCRSMRHRFFKSISVRKSIQPKQWYPTPPCQSVILRTIKTMIDCTSYFVRVRSWAFPTLNRPSSVLTTQIKPDRITYSRVTYISYTGRMHVCSIFSFVFYNTATKSPYDVTKPPLLPSAVHCCILSLLFCCCPFSTIVFCFCHSNLVANTVVQNAHVRQTPRSFEGRRTFHTATQLETASRLMTISQVWHFGGGGRRGKLCQKIPTQKNEATNLRICNPSCKSTQL